MQMSGLANQQVQRRQIHRKSKNNCLCNSFVVEGAGVSAQGLLHTKHTRRFSEKKSLRRPKANLKSNISPPKSNLLHYLKFLLQFYILR